jgi:hypothetical protein
VSGRLHLRWLFAVQAALLAVAAVRNLHQLNPDAIAYCRIAGYYAGGQWELAVTGYWGPLLSWLMVPLLKAGCAPLTAARVVMAVSGVVFLAGAVAVFRAFRLPPKAMLAGASIAAGWSVFWSVRNISPDLLLAGLAGLAMAATLRAVLAPCRQFALAASNGEVAATASRQHERAIAAGMWWGLAYLAKAVALPWAVLVTAGFALFATGGRPELRRELAARLGVTWLCLALVAGPWVAALSLHYGKFTFSTTGPIAHALAGPGEESRYHPAMVTLHTPDAGRVTQWEEPSRMAYRFWSPFASGESFRHQFGVVMRNFKTMFEWLAPFEAWLSANERPLWRRWLGTFDLLGFGALAIVLLVSHPAYVWRCCNLRRGRMAVLVIGLLAGLYLPFFVMAEDNRYFYPAWPCLWVAALAALPRKRSWRGRLFSLVTASFAATAVLWCGAALRGLPNPAAEAALRLGSELKAAGQAGPLAGSGLLPGGRAGLYTAFLLGERWLGDEPEAAPDRCAAAGARVVMRARESRPATVAAFASSPEWRELPQPSGVPVRVFVHENSR